MSKYHNVQTVVDGHSFASKREARRYQELCLLQQAGHIRGLTLQPKFPLVVNNVLVANYYADFGYVDCISGKSVYEDAKGVKTAVYRLKKKLVQAIHGVEITEV